MQAPTYMGILIFLGQRQIMRGLVAMTNATKDAVSGPGSPPIFLSGIHHQDIYIPDRRPDAMFYSSR
jgi:hypothetical protein